MPRLFTKPRHLSRLKSLLFAARHRLRQTEEQMYYELQEKGLGDLALDFICDKICQGFQRPWRGCSYLVFLWLMFVFWPTGDYWKRAFPERDVRTQADYVQVDAAYAEVNQIRQRITTLGAQNSYLAQDGYQDRMRLLWLEARATDQAFHELAYLTMVWTDQTLLQHRGPDGQLDGARELELMHQFMQGPEFQRIAFWKARQTSFVGFWPLCKLVAEYWWFWKLKIFLLAMLYNLLAMKDRKLRFRWHLTFGLPKFLLASAVPQIGVWVYPTRDRSTELAWALNWAVGFVVFVLSYGLPHAAQAQDPNPNDEDQKSNKTLVFDPNAQTQKPHTQPSTLMVLSFGDVTGPQGHDEQVIWVFTRGGDGPLKNLVVLQQNRGTADYKTINGNMTAGHKFRFSRWFDLTATAGPAFNYAVRGQRAGYNNQVIVFLIANWRTRFFQFSGLAKIFLPTAPNTSFGDRQIETLRGPPETTPRQLRWLAVQMENWHVQGPGQPHWNEIMIGPLLNLGQLMGKAKGFWGCWSLYPYRDFARPQPAHQRLWDFRVQFQHTFVLAN